MIVFTLEVTAILTVAFFAGCMVGCLLARQARARRMKSGTPTAKRTRSGSKARGKRKTRR